MLSGCLFPSVLTHIVHRKFIGSQEILVNISKATEFDNNNIQLTNCGWFLADFFGPSCRLGPSLAVRSFQQVNSSSKAKFPTFSLKVFKSFVPSCLLNKTQFSDYRFRVLTPNHVSSAKLIIKTPNHIYIMEQA